MTWATEDFRRPVPQTTSGIAGGGVSTTAVAVSGVSTPEGDDKPNKKYYDPRKWLRAGEQAMVARLLEAFEDLNCMNRN